MDVGGEHIPCLFTSFFQTINVIVLLCFVFGCFVELISSKNVTIFTLNKAYNNYTK